jgi:hypothetical protein
MKLNEEQKELSLGTSYLLMQPTCVVKLKELFTIYTPDGEVSLEVDVTADMVQIPEEYREIFLNMLTTKYLNKVTFTNNIFSKPLPPRKLSWWRRIKNMW